MRFLLILTALPCLATTPYTWGTKLRMANGSQSLRITHSAAGNPSDFHVTLALPLRGAAYQKITIWPTRYRSFRAETTCADPCQLEMPLQYGPPKLYVERFDASNTRLSESEWMDIPQYVPEPLTTFTMPLEVIGFEGYRLPDQVNTRTSASLLGSQRLFLRIHRPSYEGKGRVRVNSCAWIDIKRANATFLGQAKDYTFTSLDFSQPTLELSFALPSGCVAAGANRVEFEFSKEARASSGFRVLKFNFLQPDVSVSSISASGSTVTVNTATAHGYTTGDDVRLEGFKGLNWPLANFRAIKRNITVVDADTFTFTESSLVAGTWSYSGVTVAKLMVDDESFTEENPSTWAAPAGSNAATGATLANSANLLDPVFPGEAITAKCTSCHATGLRDMKYFNFSNWSNIVRSQIHGLSEQEGKDIAAYVRSNTSTAPGRPWNPPYQPCPNASVVSAYDWSGACGLEDISTEMGMLTQLASNGTSLQESDFNPTRNIAARDIRISFQLPDWIDWLPHIHPQDWFNKSATCSVPAYADGCWATSSTLSQYNAMRAAFAPHCPGTGTQCANYISSIQEGLYFRVSGQWVPAFRQGEQPVCVGDPAEAGCNTRVETEANKQQRARYDIALWGLTKTWEVHHEFDLERHGLAFFPRGGPEGTRVSPYGTRFNSSPNLMKVREIQGIFDGDEKTEAFVSHQWYHAELIMNPTRNKCCPATFIKSNPLDVPYTYGYHTGLQERGVYIPMNLVQWIMHQFQRHVNSDPTTPASYWDVKETNVGNITTQEKQQMWREIPAPDRLAVRSAAVNAAMGKWYRIAAGVEANGTAALFTPTLWYNAISAEARGANNAPEANATPQQGENMPQRVWHMIIFGGAYGLNSTIRTNLANWAATVWTGPTAVLGANINSSQTTLSFATQPAGPTQPGGWSQTAVVMQIGSEQIRCVDRAFGGQNWIGCTRGFNGTTATSHSAGATIQQVVRWSRGPTLSCSLDPDNILATCPDMDP